MMGRNAEAQLGVGNTKQLSGPIEVKLFQDKPAFVSRRITAAGTNSNALCVCYRVYNDCDSFIARFSAKKND